MTPDDSFRLRARNANDKRADIILSRSNSDFANLNSKSPNQIIIQLNPETKQNQNSSLHNSMNSSSHNANYTAYGNLHRENSNHNFFNQKRPSNFNKENHNNHNGNNSKINSSVLNSKIHRSPIDPRKSSKISPIRPSFSVLDKPSRENQDKEMYRTSYNSGGANGFAGLYNLESAKNKFYNNASNNNYANVNANASNGNSNNLLIVNSASLSKSNNFDVNGINDGNYAGRNYLPNVTTNKNGNSNFKDKGFYNGNQQYILSEKK
jgi:hypothetical protein